MEQLINENNKMEINIVISIMTIIIGICIGLFFGYFFIKKYEYKGPDSNDIIKQIYIDENGKKYKWKPKICICPLNYSMNKLKNSNYKDLGH